LITIAIFGLTVNGIIFFIAAFFADLFVSVTFPLAIVSALRGLLIVTGLFFIAKAFRHLPVSIMSPLGMVVIVPLLILSWLIFGDSLSVAPIILVVAMLVFCVILVLMEGKKPNKQKGDKKKFWLGMLFFTLAMSCFMTTQILIRILGEAGLHILTISFFNSVAIFVVVITAYIILRKNPVKTFSKNIKRPIQFGIGITDTIWLYLYVPLVLAMNLGVLNAVSRISVALTVLAGILIFKEKISKKAYPVIIIIIIIGIILGLLVI